MKLKHTNINSICRILNHYYPLEIIINELTELTGDVDLDDFPEIQESIANSESLLNPDALNELSEYLNKNNVIFVLFLKKFVSETFLNNYLESYQASMFLEELNNVLMFFELRIKHHKIQKKIQSFHNGILEENLLFVDITTPFHVIDYYKESLICLNNETFRSSILFSVFALEAALKCTYKKIEKIEPGNISLHRLIKWATNRGIIDNPKDEYDELMDLKNYRNKLVHCNPSEYEEIKTNIAEDRVFADLYLINQSLNSIFN